MFLEENGKRKEKEIQDLRAQAEENVDLKNRIRQTEDKLSDIEKTLAELTKLITKEGI